MPSQCTECFISCKITVQEGLVHMSCLHLQCGNVAIVPVTMSYDRALEENHMIRENLGCKKEPESLWGFCQVRMLCFRF